MTDRELLELAAKAAGLECIGPMGDNGMRLFNGHHWNPLTDDGDALRLAVRCEMQAQFREPCDGDPCAATRRAIVRAAAKIGRTMP